MKTEDLRGRIDDTKAAAEDAHIRERMYLESLQ